MKTGFSFDGDTYDEKIRNMLETFDVALDVYQNDRPHLEKNSSSSKEKAFYLEKIRGRLLQIFVQFAVNSSINFRPTN